MSFWGKMMKIPKILVFFYFQLDVSLLFSIQCAFDSWNLWAYQVFVDGWNKSISVYLLYFQLSLQVFDISDTCIDDFKLLEVSKCKFLIQKVSTHYFSYLCEFLPICNLRNKWLKDFELTFNLTHSGQTLLCFFVVSGFIPSN